MTLFFHRAFDAARNLQARTRERWMTEQVGTAQLSMWSRGTSCIVLLIYRSMVSPQNT
jgi:hypothetical protein